jgi:hypothetical protein
MMVKKKRVRRSKKIERRQRTTPRTRWNATTRLQVQYSELAARVAVIESRVNRNSTDLDIQFVRIAQIQDQLDAYKNTQAVSSDLSTAMLPLTPTPAVES